jgi:hypothetical protein
MHERRPRWNLKRRLTNPKSRFGNLGPVPHMAFLSAHAVCAGRVRPSAFLCTSRGHTIPPMGARKSMGADRPLMGTHPPFVCSHEDFVHERKSGADPKIVWAVTFGVRIRGTCAHDSSGVDLGQRDALKSRAGARRIRTRPPDPITRLDPPIKGRWAPMLFRAPMGYRVRPGRTKEARWA